jgi:hypothetical protein
MNTEEGEMFNFAIREYEAFQHNVREALFRLLISFCFQKQADRKKKI